MLQFITHSKQTHSYKIPADPNPGASSSPCPQRRRETSVLFCVHASAARHGHQALDPVGKQGKRSKGVSPSRCYASYRVHSPHTGRIGPLHVSRQVCGTLPRCTSRTGSSALRQTDFGSWKNGETSNRALQSCLHPKLHLSRARTHIFYSDSWHSLLR